MKPSKINTCLENMVLQQLVSCRTILNLVFSALNLSSERNSAPTSNAGGVFVCQSLDGLFLACASIKILSLI